MQFNSNSSNDLYSNSKRTAAENQSENNIMEEHLQELYKYLAEKKLRMPAQSDFDRTDIDWNELNQLYQCIDLYLSSEIRTGSQIAPVLYAEKFRHFTHLFFAEEKLDLESKYKDGASVKYVGHRSQKDDGKRKGKRELKYAIYEFVLNQENMGLEELVLYSKVNIAGLSGSITKINRESNSIEVAFQDKDYQTTFNESENYAIELRYNERLYYAHMRSIWLFEKLGRGKFAVFPNGSDLIPYFDFQRMLSKYEIELRKNGGNGFDKQQNCAIFSIVNGLHGSVPFILWGPPGTGKTVTIVECIRQLVAKDPNNRILICTPSNTAADLIARRIYEDGTILDAKQMRRYYSLGKNVNDRDRKLDKIIKIENTALFGLSDGRFAIEDFNEMKKDNIRLIFSTLACSTYLEERIQDEDFITHIFIDEASQSFEPETLIPITRFATEKTRIILSGDHQQLGAVMKAHFLKLYKQCTTSLMERLMTPGAGTSAYNDGRTYCQLTDSYRCHPHIIKFSSDNFYGSKLRAVKGDERTGFCKWSYLPKKNFPIILHIVSTGTEARQGEGRSYYNAGELEVVLDYIRHIRTTMPHIEDKEIGVISPYKFQTQKIRERLVRNPNITVDSVECYQGSERRVIIMSLARSDQPGFLTEPKRINTSFTRAKELLIVVLSLSFVRNLHNHRANYWNAFINYCMENDAITIDKFVGENGRELSAQEISTFRNQIRNCQYSTPTKMTPREERKKLPPELAHYKEKEQWRDPNEIKSIPIVPKSSSSHSSSAFVPINSPTNSTSTTSSSSSTSSSLQEFSSTSSNAQNIQPKKKFVTRQLVSPEKAKEMLREIRRAKGEEEEMSSNSEADGKEFWAHQFANCPTANKMARRIRNKESPLNPYGVVAQMGGPISYEDRSEPIHINALICHENEDEEEEDSELSELLGMHSDSPKDQPTFEPLPEPLIQPVSDILNSPPAKNIPVEAIEIASEGAENLMGNADMATSSSGGHWKFEKQSSKNCAIM